MHELVRTNDPVLVTAVEALLKGASIRFVVLDGNMSVLEGSLGKYVDFKVMPDFAGSSFTLFDAYVDLKPFEFLKLRAGKFKPPVGLERLQSAKDLIFVERALPTNLVPNRSVGLEIWGAPFDGALTYELGAFDFAPDLGNVNGNLNDDFTFDGRVFAQPFISTDIAAVKGLGAGISGSYGSQIGTLSNSDLPTYKSAGQANIFSYVTGTTIDKQAIQSGNLTRFEPQAYWYFGPLGVLFEYNQSRTPVTLDKTSDTIANAAWQVTGQWILTGEENSFKGITVKNPFDPWNGKWGAVAVSARYGTLDVDRDAFRLKFADPTKSVQRAEEFALGTEWFWNRNIQVYLDYFQTEFYKGAGSGTYNRPTEHAVIGRIQPVAFAFVFAMSGAVGPIIGQNLGAGQAARRATLPAVRRAFFPRASPSPRGSACRHRVRARWQGPREARASCRRPSPSSCRPWSGAS